MLQPDALDTLQALRDEAGPLTVNFAGHKLRGYRSQEENDAIPGAPYSRHTQGIAFDVSSREHTPSELSEMGLNVGFTYAKVYRTWVHLDTGVRL